MNRLSLHTRNLGTSHHQPAIIGQQSTASNQQPEINIQPSAISSSTMMLIKDIVNPQEGHKILTIELNVLKDLGKNHHVVADDSGQTIVLDMNKSEVKSEDKIDTVTEGSRIRMIKPKVSGDDVKVISPDKFKVINIGKSKGGKLPQCKEEVMNKYQDYVNKQQKVNGTTLNDTEKMGKNITIPEMSLFTVSVSRRIEGKYGDYQIVNFKDLAGNKGALNLYGNKVGQMEPGKSYTIKKFVKSGMAKADGEYTRLAVKYGSLNEAEDSVNKMFNDVKLGEQDIEGEVIGIADIEVKESSGDGEPKLYATLYVQGSEDVQQVKMYEWNLRNKRPLQGNTENWLNSELLSKQVSIEADVSYSGDGLSAVRIKIHNQKLFTSKGDKASNKQ